MITTIKDTDGKVIAMCEWRLVGQSGLDVPCGEYVWINDMWVHESFRHTHRVNRLIDEIMRLAPTARYGYFQRKSHNEKIRIFTRTQWERRRMSYDPVMKEK